jgi:hypothetical protein
MPLEADYELTVPKVHISAGSRKEGSSDAGEIRVTQGFVSVHTESNDQR